MKKWGKGEYWGLSADYDPEWLLTEKQKKLRDDLIELCRVKIRPHAIHCDKVYEFPRESLNAMADLGLFGLVVPKRVWWFGGEPQICCRRGGNLGALWLSLHCHDIHHAPGSVRNTSLQVP